MLEHQFQGDTGDLVAVLRLTLMPAATRRATIASVRDFRTLLTGGSDLPVAAFAAALDAADAAMRAALGDRHSQILSDGRRALRAWSDEPRRALAIRLRGRIPTLEDAVAAAKAAWPADKAHRAETALSRLAAVQGTSLAGLDATALVVEPLLRAATPETFGVEAAKSLQNMCGLVRAAVALVDPDRVRGREGDVKSLPAEWLKVLLILTARTPKHAQAERAIHRRLAATAARDGLAPAQITPSFAQRFVKRERATKGPSHPEKLRYALRRWNGAVAEGLIPSIELPLEVARVRLPDVAWEAVPPAIREPLDAVVGRVQSPTGGLDWSATVPGTDKHDLDDELGLAGLGDEAPDVKGLLLREPGTVKNWTDAVKRVWHAAATDPRITPKPARIEDLYTKPCVVAVVRAIRSARRARLEAQGTAWEGQERGRYETSLVEAFLAAGRALGIPDERLAPIAAMVPEIDPSVVGKKLQPDGRVKHVYEDGRIGPRHAGMLKQIAQESALRRWFEAPRTLWGLAEAPLRRGKTPTLRHAALARSALLAQICQRVSPLRRMNLVRLRIGGDAPHIQLPLGKGEGWLVLSAIETKNLRQIKVRIDPDTVDMIRQYIATFRPVLAKAAGALPENEHLFPGAGSERKERGANGRYGPGLGYFTKEKLNAVFAGHMRRHALLRMDLHVMRHLAAKVILDQDPSAMALVQEILGHKKIETTRAYYAEVCGLIAQDRYLALLDRATRKALAQVSFRIGIEQELKG